MPRPAGSKNKPKELDIISDDTNNEDLFLAELIRGKAKWTRIAKELSEKGFANDKELEYAGAYKILINKFTNDDKD